MSNATRTKNGGGQPADSLSSTGNTSTSSSKNVELSYKKDYREHTHPYYSTDVNAFTTPPPEETYTFTLLDVEDYLDGKQEHQIIGLTYNPSLCLVACAFKEKYPCATHVSVGPDEINWQQGGVLLRSFSFGREIQTLVREFDLLGYATVADRAITKRAWLESQAAGLEGAR